MIETEAYQKAFGLLLTTDLHPGKWRTQNNRWFS